MDFFQVIFEIVNIKRFETKKYFRPFYIYNVLTNHEKYDIL